MEIEYTLITSERPLSSSNDAGNVAGKSAGKRGSAPSFRRSDIGGGGGGGSGVDIDTDLINALGAEAKETWSVEQIKAQPHEMADVHNDARTVSITPAMPVSLIAPVQSKKIDESSGANVAWGIEAVDADRSRFTGEGIDVAVLDTGIMRLHPAFGGMNIQAKNFTSDASSDDGNGHGTHCAGTIAGQETDGIRIGITKNLNSLIIGKVLDDQGAGSTTSIVQGIQWASLQGAHVISMSLGIDFTAYVEYLHQEYDVELKAAVSMALQAYSDNVEMFEKLGDSFSALSYIGQGSLLVAAAGNESQRPSYTIATSPPAVADSIVSVAAIDENFEAAGFSNTYADVSAPGVDIHSAGLDGGISTLSGTSMAAPHVTGVAALWAQKLMERESQLNIDRLKETLFANVASASDQSLPDLENTGRGVVKAPIN